MSDAKHQHLVEFYETDLALARCVHNFMAPALRRGEPSIVVATAEHREMFERLFRQSGIDLDGAANCGLYVALDAADTLAQFMVGSSPHSAGFDATVGALVRTTRGKFKNVHVYGEMVALLWQDGYSGAALELEQLWNGLAKQQDFELLCAYPTSVFELGAGTNAFWQVCECHSSSTLTAGPSARTIPFPPTPKSDGLKNDIEALRSAIERALQLGQLAEGVINIDTSCPDGFIYGLRSPRLSGRNARAI